MGSSGSADSRFSTEPHPGIVVFLSQRMELGLRETRELEIGIGADFFFFFFLAVSWRCSSGGGGGDAGLGFFDIKKKGE